MKKRKPVPITPLNRDSNNTAEEINAVFEAAHNALWRLTPVTLLPGEATRLGGWLSPMSSSLVEAMANDLTYNAALFPDIPVRGADLRKRQRAADAWVFLRELMLYWARRAGETALKLHSECAQTTMRILQHVESGGTRIFEPMDPREHMQRLMALAPTINVRRCYRQKVQKIKQRAQKQRAEQAGAPAAAPPKPPSRQRRAARAQDRAYVEAAILEVFHEHMARQRPAQGDPATPGKEPL